MSLITFAYSVRFRRCNPGGGVSCNTNKLGVCAPGKTPVEIVEKLSQEINEALADPKMKARLADVGGTPFAGSPADFGKLIAEETEKWGKVIRAANIKAE